MRCWRAKGLFSAYMDDELRGRELDAFSAHLDGCPTCRRELAELRALKEAVGSVGYRLPADFHQAVLSHSRLADLVTERFRSRSEARSARPNLRLVLVAASVVIIAVGVGLLGLDNMAGTASPMALDLPQISDRVTDSSPSPATELRREGDGVADAVAEAVHNDSGPEEYLSEHLAAAEVSQSSTEELSRHVLADEALSRAADVPVEISTGARFSLVSAGSPIPDADAGLPSLPAGDAADVDTEPAAEATGE
ncbi:MAG TPA: zf-HC2 domain-containing protein [bacterium]|nr:zf-HC2 domain-containing protein [bacterium]